MGSAHRATASEPPSIGSMRVVERRALLWVIVVAGVAVGGLSLMPGWVVHTRAVLGEGTRLVVTEPGPWDGQAVPVLSAAVLLEIVVALGAAVQLARSSGGSRVLVVAALVGLGLLLAVSWPVSQSGHASGVTITPSWPMALAIAAGVVAVVASLLAASLRPPLVALALGAIVLVAIGGAAARWIELNLAEGNGQHWAEGSYTRHATGGEATETLTMQGGTYRLGARWSGTFEPSGLVVVLTGDPACPGDRGSYHVRSVAATQDITWDAIVDLCSNGARARDLETGTWVRNR